MTKKLTDADVKKALEQKIEYCREFDENNDAIVKVSLLENALGLINRLETKNSNLQEKNSNLSSNLSSLQKDLTSTKAEVERLQNAYKQCAWERDIFAEDMKEEIKKDCSYLMLDIKTIKAEAYKEAFEKAIKLIETKAFNLSLMRSLYTGQSSKALYSCAKDIKNLLKELVGDADE